MKKIMVILLSILLLINLLPTASINAKGTADFVIPPQFLGVSEFIDGTALIFGNSYFSIIDREGNIVKTINKRYGHTGYYNEGLAAVRLDERIAGQGFKHSIGYINLKTGEEVIIPQYDWRLDFNRLDDPMKKFSEGLAAVRKGDLWGYIDQTGNEIIRFQYENARDFQDGLAPVKLGDKWGYINKSGQVVINFIYDDATSFSEGRAAVMVEDKWGYIDTSGKVIVKPQYKHSVFFYTATPFKEGVAWVEYESDKWGAIDRSGRVVIQPKYPFRTAFYDTKKILYPVNMQFHEGLAAFPEGDKWGFVDKKGNEVIKPQFDLAYHFSEGLAPVKKNGKWGYINTKGELVLDYQFDSAFNFSEGLAPVSTGGKIGFIANPLNVPSTWAMAEVEEAISLGLVPQGMQYSFTSNITRADFSKLAVHLLTVKTNKPIDVLLAERGIAVNSTVFKDTQDATILAAHALGIVNGKGNSLFDPFGEITRQEAAIMLTRTAHIAGLEVQGEKHSFSDYQHIAGWAQEGVAFVATTEDKTNRAKIMGGTGDNKFSPQEKYTRQQAIITIKRLFNA